MNKKELIEKLKKNERPFGLLSKEEQKTLEEVGYKNRMLYSGLEWIDNWTDVIDETNVYCIKSDYDPELSIEKCKVFRSAINGLLMYQRRGDHFCCYLSNAADDPTFCGFWYQQYGLVAQPRTTSKPGEPMLAPDEVWFKKKTGE